VNATGRRDLQRALDELCERRKVPGASVAFFDGEVTLAASGTANVATGVETTTETLMHVGSITKVMNATLAMQLVDENALDLERPVSDYLPDLRLGDETAARTITVEQLLNHTSGIDANLLPDTGHDNETLDKTIARFASAPQLHRPGHARSYCNAGTVLAGHLSARVAGASWYDLMKTRIFARLGLQSAAVLPEDALLHRTSVGHFLEPSSGALTRSSHMFLPLSYAPAGSTNMMSANDLLTFARAHLGDGLGPNGTRLLSEQSAARMRRRSGPVHGGPETFDCGIGWVRVKNGFVQHGGGGPGIVSLVIIHPESQTAAVVLTNAEHGLELIVDMMRPFLKARAGVDPFTPPPQPLADANIDLAPYPGLYENNTVELEVAERDGALTLSARVKHQVYDSSVMDWTPPRKLIPAGDGWFLGEAPSALGALPYRFVDPDANGKCRYLSQSLWLFGRRGAER
jgi:CubicO group peptidase (beta-lactamase class C family)